MVKPSYEGLRNNLSVQLVVATEAFWQGRNKLTKQQKEHGRLKLDATCMRAVAQLITRAQSKRKRQHFFQPSTNSR